MCLLWFSLYYCRGFILQYIALWAVVIRCYIHTIDLKITCLWFEKRYQLGSHSLHITSSCFIHSYTKLVNVLDFLWSLVVMLLWNSYVCNLRLKGCIWHTFKVYQTRDPGLHPSWHLCISHFSFVLIHLLLWILSIAAPKLWNIFHKTLAFQMVLFSLAAFNIVL